MAELEFFWDPMCPWAWLTSRWVMNVMAERPIDVDWKFISLRLVNADRDYERDFPAGYERAHTLGLELLRVAAAVRAEAGHEAMLPLYSAYGQLIHLDRNRAALDHSGIEAVLKDQGHDPALADAAYDHKYDDIVGAETTEALERCGGNIGTPVLTFSPPDGPSFFGPVISKAPKGREAVALWDAVVTLGTNPHFSELKRSLRGKPEFD